MHVRLLLYLLFSATVLADDDATVRSLLSKLKAAEPQIAKRLESFGYIEHWVEESDGKVKTRETYEVTFYKDRRIRRMTEKNGTALAGVALEKENKQVEKLITQLEKGTAPPLDNRRIRLEDLIRASSFSNVSHAKIQGRDVTVAEFHPKPGFKPANVNERFVHNLDGKLWVDEQALQFARLEFMLRDSFKIAGGLFFAMRPGTRFTDESEWFQNEVWLPRRREFAMTAKAMIGVKLNIRNTVEFGDYHRFGVNAKDSVGAPAGAGVRK